MRVRFLGLALEPKSPITLEELVDYLVKKRNTEYSLNEHARYIFVNKTHNSKYYLGVLITVKDQRRFCELQKRREGNFQIKVNNLEENSHIMDFNFFVINKNNGLCLYQYYHQSCSINQFGYLLSNLYNEMREGATSKEIKKAGGDKANKSTKKKINKKYRGRLEYQQLVTKEKLKEILKEFDKIKAFEVDFASLVAEEKAFKPLSRFVRKERRTFSFSASSPVTAIANHIHSIANSLDIKAGRVRGKDIHGIDRVVQLEDNPCDFGEFDYDEVAAKINTLSMDEFYTSWVIRKLLEGCKANDHIFEASIKK